MINKKPIGQRELPLVYLQRREKPSHMTWEWWYKYTNEKYHNKHQAEIKQEELFHKQKEDEENMANALTIDFFSSENFGFNGSDQNGVAAVLLENEPKELDKSDNLCTTTTTNRSVVNKKVESEVEMVNKILNLSKDIQDVIMEIAELFLDPDVVFAMHKLKEVGKAMKDVPGANVISKEVSSMMATLEKGQEQAPLMVAKDIKKELTYEESKKNPSQPKPMFLSASKATFDQFSNLMKAPKRKIGASPGRLGSISSPKSAKKHPSTANHKSLTETKMDIILEGIAVLKCKKAGKVAQSLWNEVSSMGHIVLNPPETTFYSFMSNVSLFLHLEQLQESARGAKLKADLFDFIGSNVQYFRVSCVHNPFIFVSYFGTILLLTTKC